MSNQDLTERFAFANNVRVYSYSVTINGESHLSYEVFWNDEQVQRFLYIDVGDLAGELAKAWALGFATATTKLIQ